MQKLAITRKPFPGYQVSGKKEILSKLYIGTYIVVTAGNDISKGRILSFVLAASRSCIMLFVGKCGDFRYYCKN